MRLRFLFAAALALQCAAQSQVKNVPPGATKINYVARIPPSVVKWRPKTAITRFYGLTTIQGQKLALHFYDLKPIKKLAANGIHNSRLDVFVVRRGRKALFYKRMHTIALKRVVSLGPMTKIVCEMLKCWLNPTRKTKPIILARITTQSPYSGFARADTILTFKNGLRKKPAINIFEGVGGNGWHEWEMDYRRALDKNGFLVPWTLEFQNSKLIYMVVYKWNGQTFKETASQYDKQDDFLIYRWDGEKFVEQDLGQG